MSLLSNATWLVIPLILYTGIELLLILSFLRRKNKVAVKSSLLTAVFMWIAYLARYLFDISIPNLAFIFVIISALMNSLFGYYLNLFHRSKTFDRFMHATGSFSLSLFLYFLLSNFFDYGGSRAFQSLYVFLLGLAVGALYEISEYFSDKANPDVDERMQHGLKDTDFDLIFNTLGSFCAAVFAYFILL